MLAVTPVEPDKPGQVPVLVDDSVNERINLTRPPDKDNELIKVAAVHGPPGILAVLRARREYGWFVILCLRAIEVCLARSPSPDIKHQTDPVAFSMQMLELEMIDEIFQLMKHFEHLRDVQKKGLAIIELLTMEDSEWRDEVA